MTGPVLIGVDGGGSRTTVAVSRGGDVIGRAEGPASAVRPGRALVSATTIADAVRRALSAAGVLTGDVLVAGVAGAGRETEARELQQALRGEGIARTVVVTTDIAIALEGALGGGAGIVVSAGTGSIAIGRDAAGAEYRAGGYGWQMGDEGSGYAIGRAALGAVGRAIDCRGAETTLTDQLQAATRSDDFDGLVRWTATAGPAEVASLAAHVLAASAAGDPVAAAIVHYAAEELAQLVVSIRKRMGGPGVPVALAGGLLHDAAFRSAVTGRLAKQGVEVSDSPVDAVAGALALASRG
jgi:glucosamine kinase